MCLFLQNRHEHCLGYQFVQLPNGLNICFGPFNGLYLKFPNPEFSIDLRFLGFEHDSRSVKMIQLEDKLCEKLRGS